MSHKKSDAPKPETGSPQTLPTQPDARVGRGLKAILDGPWAPLRREVRERLDDPALLPDPGLSLDEQRERLLGQVRMMASSDV